MLAVPRLDEGGVSRRRRGPRPLGLIVTVGIDLLIDGLLLGVVPAQGSRGGLLLGVAYSIEMVSLGLATSAELGQASASQARRIVTTSALAVMFLVGAAVGALLGDLPDPVIAGFYGAGATVLTATRHGDVIM